MIPIHNTAPPPQFPVIVLALIVINALVFLWIATLEPDQLTFVIEHIALVPSNYSDLWRPWS